MKTIVFDIDDVLTEETEFMRRFAPTYLHKVYGWDVSVVNPNGYELSEVYGIKDILVILGYTEADAEMKARKISQKFWNKHFIKYCNEPLREGAREVIATYRKLGYEIRIVSMRGKKTKEKESRKDLFVRKKIVPLLTKWQLWKGRVKYDYLEMPSVINDKVEYIRAINPEYVFEDQIFLLNEMVKVLGSDSKVICMNNCHNTTSELEDGVIRINGFNDIKLVEEMEKLSNFKRGKEKTSSSFKVFYKFIKFIGSPIVFHKYHPLIVGKRRIPKDKSLAFVGNHRKKGDPIIMIAIVKQIIHWAALQRLLDGGEDLFSSSKKKWRCKLSARFLRLMGVIPIAREDCPDYQKINYDTIHFLIRTLKDKKASIGFFPEGTHNNDFQKREILPLKSNRVFRVVNSSGSYIQPFSIVWIPENKVIRNKVIVTFGYSINSEKRSVNELNEMWETVQKNNIQRSNTFIEKLLEIDTKNCNLSEKRKNAKCLMKELMD
ncbi:MAG: 1-acyl-sn-glycerol-3-phosphate acyltransferase [Lachnospiraceae bacterium]|nr:1-acyl-sn-glycerol-3-phosphate acyltransferase [Lachnospiraceae bacterium]